MRAGLTPLLRVDHDRGCEVWLIDGQEVDVVPPRVVNMLTPFESYTAHVLAFYHHTAGAAEHVSEGVVYFIRTDGFIKVGRTTNFDNRLAKLQTGSPHELEVLLVVPGGSGLEADIHRDLKEYRHRGEWFRETPEVWEYIRGLDD